MALITTLVDKFDSFEIVRDQIAAILVLESAAQQALAIEADKDPELWRLRVFTERSNPWSEWLLSPDNGTEDSAPIVNVSFESATFPMSGGNVVEMQRCAGMFQIDCYGYGKSEDVEGGHQPGDELAALEVQRAIRLVRNILMSGPYVYLGLRGLVGRRWPQSLNIFQPASEGRAVQHVIGARLTLQVDFNEYSPQAQGVPLESLSLRVTRSDSGQVLMRAQYPKD